MACEVRKFLLTLLNRRFLDFFRGYKSGTLVENGFIPVSVADKIKKRGYANQSSYSRFKVEYVSEQFCHSLFNVLLLEQCRMSAITVILHM